MRAAALLLLSLLVVAGCQSRTPRPFEIPVSKKKGKTGRWELNLNDGKYVVIGHADSAEVHYRDRVFIIKDFPSFGGYLNPYNINLIGGGTEVKIAEGVALVDVKRDAYAINFDRVPPGATAIFENLEWRVTRGGGG